MAAAYEKKILLDKTKEAETENFTNVCRVCMHKKVFLKSVFSAELHRTVEELKFCTGILITKEDGLPTMVCDSCLINLSVAYEFKTTCVHSDKLFRKGLGQKVLSKDSIKEEVVDDIDEAYQHVVTKQEVERDDDDDDDYMDEFDIKDEKCDKPLPSLSTRTKTARAKKKNVMKCNNDPVKKMTRLYCHECDLKFSNKVLCLQHKKKVHGCEWICEICGKQFMHRASHYSHVKSHLPPNYKCSQCDYKTWQKADMNKHIRIHTGVKHFVCEYCTSSFSNTSNLYGHIRRKHGGVKTHCCPRCDLTFFSANKLKRHLDSHDNIKRHECEVCHAHFSRRCYWKKHLQKQHSITVPRIRPGRRKINLVTGDMPEEKLHIVEASVKK